MTEKDALKNILEQYVIPESESRAVFFSLPKGTTMFISTHYQEKSERRLYPFV